MSRNKLIQPQRKLQGLLMSLLFRVLICTWHCINMLMLIAALFLELNCVVHNCWFIKRNNEFGWFGFFLLTWLGRALIVFQVQVILVFRKKVELKMHWLLAHLCNQRRGELSLSVSAFIFTAKVSMNNNALLIYLIYLFCPAGYIFCDTSTTEFQCIF